MKNREIFENKKADSTLEGSTLVRGIEGAYESIDDLKNQFNTIESLVNRLESQSVEHKNAMTKEYENSFYNAVSMAFQENKRFEDCIDSKFTNDVQGFPFPERIDYSIRSAWKNYEHIFSVLRNTERTQFLVNTMSQDDTKVKAKVHTPKSQKEEQELTITAINFYQEYIYKLNYLERKDMKKAENDGRLAELIAELFYEITMQIVYEIVKSILATSLTTAGGTVIESIADSALKVSVTGATTIPNVRALADKVSSETGRKIAFMTNETKTSLMALAPGSTSGLFYMTEDIACAQMGVDEIITFKGMSSTNPVVVLAENAYAVMNITDMQRVQFDKWEVNRQGLLVEILTSGRLIQPEGAGVLING